jgi:hypothetical protein
MNWQKPPTHAAPGSQQSATVLHFSSICEQRFVLQSHVPTPDLLAHNPQQQSTPVLQLSVSL